MSLFALIAFPCLWFVQTGGQNQPWKFLIFDDTRGTDPDNPVNTYILTELARDTNNQRPAFVLVPGAL